MKRLVKRMQDFLITFFYPNFTYSDSFSENATHLIVTQGFNEADGTGNTMFTINITIRTLYIERIVSSNYKKEFAYLVKWAKQENYKIVDYSK